MIVDIILIFIIIVCLTGIIFIFLRKLPFITTINFSQQPQSQQAQVKKSLLKERLKRRLAEIKETFNLWLSSLRKQNKKS